MKPSFSLVITEGLQKPAACLTRAGFLILFLTAAFFSDAQGAKLPPFKMIRDNGTIFNATQLPMGKPIVLIYFSPGCGHCEQLMRNVLKQENALTRTSVVLITYQPVQEVIGFVQQFHLQSHLNFYVGTERNSFLVRGYYHLEKLPFIALFTKKGDLVCKYNSEKDWNLLLKQLKKLQ
ncbi:MAG: hypothetical protein J7539_09365 [Niabella sp.]|nr:hypothetical protein [Niabella sp.]